MKRNSSENLEEGNRGLMLTMKRTSPRNKGIQNQRITVPKEKTGDFRLKTKSTLTVLDPIFQESTL